jgi:hypothetical protein
VEVEDLEAVGVKPLFHKNRHQKRYVCYTITLIFSQKPAPKTLCLLYHNSYFFAKTGTYQAINLCKNINLNDLQNNKDEFQLLCT